MEPAPIRPGSLFSSVVSDSSGDRKIACYLVVSDLQSNGQYSALVNFFDDSFRIVRLAQQLGGPGWIR